MKQKVNTVEQRRLLRRRTRGKGKTTRRGRMRKRRTLRMNPVASRFLYPERNGAEKSGYRDARRLRLDALGLQLLPTPFGLVPE